MRRIYMGGICGMGMSPLAAFLRKDGVEVSGFDDTPNAELKLRLEDLGVKFSNPNGTYDAVVISTALASRRDELAKLTSCKNIMRRGECWAEICSTRKLTAIVGSHGKSTVSALLAHAINKLSLDSGYLVGAIPNAFPMHKYCQQGSRIISEIDESDATIENFSPEITIALNADLDHTDTYADNGKLASMFDRLFARTKKLVLYPESDSILKSVASKYPQKSRAIPIDADYRIANKTIASAALLATFPEIEKLPYDLFDDFSGVQRRNEVIFDNKNLIVVSDYAHHPSEVSAFLKGYLPTARGEKFVFFQPHRYTRTRSFANDFARILTDASKVAKVFVLPVYPASEPHDSRGESSSITSLCPQGAFVRLAEKQDFFKIAKEALDNSTKASIAFVGAGDFHFEVKKFFNK